MVEQTLKGEGAHLKERTLGIAVFSRSPEYDTSADPVVRNTASEVRKRIDEYYGELEHQHELRITLPVGSYVPEFKDPSEHARQLAEEREERLAVDETPRSSRPRRTWAFVALVTVCLSLAQLLGSFGKSRLSTGSGRQFFEVPVQS